MYRGVFFKPLSDNVVWGSNIYLLGSFSFFFAFFQSVDGGILVISSTDIDMYSRSMPPLKSLYTGTSLLSMPTTRYFFSTFICCCVDRGGTGYTQGLPVLGLYQADKAQVVVSPCESNRPLLSPLLEHGGTITGDHS